MDCPTLKTDKDEKIADLARALYLADQEVLEAFELEDETDEFESPLNEAYDALMAALRMESENG